jgi:hypothetical protein
MFVLFGIHATPATSATIVYHAISLWIPAMWGTFAFIMLRRTRHQPLTLRPSREDRRALREARRARQVVQEAIAEDSAESPDP